MPLEIDEVDASIINEYLKDGRATLRKLAAVTGLSPPAVLKRLRRLQGSGVILGTTIRLDRNRLPGLASMVALLKVKDQYLRAAIDRLTAEPEVISVYRVIGGYNLFVRAESYSLERLNDLMGEINGLDGIEDSSIYIVREYLKDEQFSPVGGKAKVSLVCSTCGNRIEGKPYSLQHRGRTLYFCCPTCLKEFKATHELA